MANDLQIGLMTADEVPFAASLTTREGWGHAPEDFQRFLSLNPTGCFVARQDNDLVGIITSIRHGTYAFLGNLIVPAEHRGRKIGERLMLAAIEQLQKNKIKSIELDGVIPALSLYRRLGFKDKYLSLRFYRPPTAAPERIHPAEKISAAAIARFDRATTGLRRQAVLNRFFEEYRENLFAVGPGLSGYAFVRPRETDAFAIGPLLAQDFHRAQTLLKTILAVYGHKSLFIGVPESNRRMIALLLDRGFIYRQPSLRMYHGKKIDYEKHVYAILAPDMG